MTDNETIARWMGPFIEDSAGEAAASEGSLIMRDGCVRIAASKFDLRTKVRNRVWKRWCPDKDIAFWYGKDGLLAKVKAKGKLRALMHCLNEICKALYRERPQTTFHVRNDWDEFLLMATPAQLTAALVKVIGGRK